MDKLNLKKITKIFFNYQDIDFLNKQKMFFQNIPGGYGEHDVFIGVKVPIIRKIAKEYCSNFNLQNIEMLLHSKYHEIRFCALVLLIKKFKQTLSYEQQHTIINIYLKNTQFINNWDLVDLSAPILGEFIYNWNLKKDYILIIPESIKNLFFSYNLWDMRIAIVSNLYLIKKQIFYPLFYLFFSYINIDKNIKYSHLLDKALGWCLREIGKQKPELLKKFLIKYKNIMPSIMFSYANEKLKIII